MEQFKKLLNILKTQKHAYIQTHNFPDHDAVASSFALQYLLERNNISSTIIYVGEIQRMSLKRLIQELDIPIKREDACLRTEQDKIIIVDGCKGNKNVLDLIGQELAVIDHHNVTSPDDVIYSDIRPEYGACASILFDYFRSENQEIPRKIATALLTGLLVDTALMTRGVCAADLEAYAELYVRADVGFVNSLLRNCIQKKELSFYKYVIENVKVQERFAFCYFGEGCNQNLLGIIGDFLLSLNEVDFVFLCAKNNDTINISVRSEVPRWNAAAVTRQVLDGIGFGGGHSDLAGGIIEHCRELNQEDMFRRVVSALQKEKSDFKKT
ncbi:MAG: DHH family phosphoesterase [Spirochaetales bacterium]|nr:DHH family phosphoesterase [Spirochaetales bacterium]